MRRAGVHTGLARVQREDPARRLGPAEADILAQEGQRLATALDKAHPLGAARKRLEPEGAGAREHIEHMRPRHRIAIAARQHVEEALANPVGGGAQMRRRVALADTGKRPPAMRAADDPHGFKSGLRSAPASATRTGSADFPASISRLPTI